jgi:hypothetical protein
MLFKIIAIEKKKKVNIKQVVYVLKCRPPVNGLIVSNANTEYIKSFDTPNI